METETQTRDEVQATMNYVADPEQKPVSYMYQPPEGTPQRSWHVSKHPTVIHKPGRSSTSCRWTARVSS